MKRRSARMLFGAAVVAVGLTGMTGAPAGAHPGAGAVTGTVTVSPGVDLTARSTTYTFTPITIVGVVGGCPGTFTTSTISGGSSSESVLNASATVGSFSFSGTGPASACSVSGTASGGSVVRVGGVGLVTITANVTVCLAVAGCSGPTGTTIVLVAGFAPTAGNGVTDMITQATFAGAAVLV